MPTRFATPIATNLISTIYRNVENISAHTRAKSLSFAIFAQYGGLAEPGTDICAQKIAGENLSLHTLACRTVTAEADVAHDAPRPIHNHPDGIALAEKCQTVVSLRGRYSSQVMAGEVSVDGLDNALVDSLTQSLSHMGFIAIRNTSQSRAKHPDNICNRGTRGRGVELDISNELRLRLLNEPALMTNFACAVRTGLMSALPDC